MSQGDATNRDPKTMEIAQRSRKLLCTAKKTIYFLNMCTLFDSKGGFSTLNRAQHLILCKRLKFLSETFPPGHKLIVILSRVREMEKLDFNTLFQAPSSTLPISDIMLQFLRREVQRHHWNFELESCYYANHLRPCPSPTIPPSQVECMHSHSLSLDIAGVKKTLLALLRDRTAVPTAPSLVCMPYVFECFKDLTSSINIAQGEQVEIWVHEETLSNYLETKPCEVPPNTVVKQFPNVAKQLADSGICWLHYAGGHPNVSILFSLHFDSSPQVLMGLYEPWSYTSQRPTARDADMTAMRFPLFRPLFEMVCSIFERELPSELLLQPGHLSLLPKVEQELITMICDVWEQSVSSTSHNSPLPLGLFTLFMEDWLLIQKLKISPTGGTTSNFHTFPIPLNLPTSLIHPNHPSSINTTNGPIALTEHEPSNMATNHVVLCNASVTPKTTTSST
ncbi:hypothetical protein Pelo_10824 [Pelomyxa schiedti]|nr:hypothetical protein Pelo_10824 [Pelomyxa schiedti]